MLSLTSCSSRRLRPSLIIALLLAILIALTLLGSGEHKSIDRLDALGPVSYRCPQDRTQKPYHLAPAKGTPLARKNVAFSSHFGFHFDVYMALVWTLSQVLDPTHNSHTSLRVFAEQPFKFNFNEIVDMFGLHNGQIHDPHALVRHVGENRGEGAIDLVVLGTCEIDMVAYSDDLLDAWEARDEDHKFMLVCMVHDYQDNGWQQLIPEWSRRNSIRIVTLGKHVTDAFRKDFRTRADDLSPRLHTAGYEYIKVDTHVPVLDIPYLPNKLANRALSKAVIQGTFSTERRDFRRIFEELTAFLHEDPYAWGYLPLSDEPSYLADPEAAVPPFQLAIIGSGYLEIPTVLQNVVTIYQSLDYKDFYAFMSHMDIVVPAFAENGYFERQASSTVALAVEVNVPILATERMRKAYGYIDDDTAVITRPAAMTEMQALKALRTGNADFFFEALVRFLTVPGVVRMRELHVAVDKMLQTPWTRDKAAFERLKRGVWAENQAVAERLLRDL